MPTTTMKPVRFKPVTKKQFDAMTPEARRVMIAKDLLLHLKSKRFSTRYGYFSSNVALPGGETDQISKFLRKPEVRCYGCAIAGLFYAAVVRFNDLTAAQCGARDHSHIGDSDLRRLLRKYMSSSQVLLIENCYELRFLLLKGRGLQWADERKRDAPMSRLVGICENMIKNNGTFVP